MGSGHQQWYRGYQTTYIPSERIWTEHIPGCRFEAQEFKLKDVGQGLEQELDTYGIGDEA
jgi:hypothetical protein